MFENKTATLARISLLDCPVAAPAWLVRVARVEAYQQCEGFRVTAPGRFQYIVITLKYAHLGIELMEFRPVSVTLVHVGPSPLQGLARQPVFFRAVGHPSVAQPLKEIVTCYVDAGTVQTGAFVYEFHTTCRDFQLYFPGCEAIPIRLP